jgi:hypothetical protein
MFIGSGFKTFNRVTAKSERGVQPHQYMRILEIERYAETKELGPRGRFETPSILYAQSIGNPVCRHSSPRISQQAANLLPFPSEWKGETR